MSAPTVPEVQAYLTSIGLTPQPLTVENAYEAEKAAQARVCEVPADGADWPADLAEALCRRVAVNLTVRGLPLGVQASISEAAVGIARVGGGDREVDRLEGPYRTIPIA
ncbi:hypothetical protein [Nocardioides sp. J54]|uniref:hypothetical protein n=1 Tax=Nocardioides sp. J54 TaxID=935866 RepID=UPI00048ED794|nr:hypothetical protein [Nocardioides sp. J54]